MDQELIAAEPVLEEDSGPAFAQLKALVLDSVASTHAKRAYGSALSEFFAWFVRQAPRPTFNKATVQRFRASLEARRLAPASINVRLSAIRKLALEAADNGWMAAEIAAGIGHVRGPRRSGQRLGNWVTAEQAKGLLRAGQRPAFPP